MRCFLAADDVADGLLDLALEGREPPLPHLRARFDALDYDRATLPVDFDAALTALTRGLTDALLAAAMAPDSPLHHRPQGRELSGASTSAHHRPFKSSEPPSRGRRQACTAALHNQKHPAPVSGASTSAHHRPALSKAPSPRLGGVDERAPPPSGTRAWSLFRLGGVAKRTIKSTQPP